MWGCCIIPRYTSIYASGYSASAHAQLSYQDGTLERLNSKRDSLPSVQNLD
jgi:hypothetical protein